MTHTADKENSEPSIGAIIHDMRKAWARTTAGEWGKGNTTHETVARGGREKEYRIAEFRHADDAAFCDLAHALTPRICEELERQHARIAELEDQLEAVGAGGVQPLQKTVAASACSGCGSCQKQCQSKEEQAQAATVFDSTHSMSMYASKDDMLKAVMAENEQLRAQLAAAQLDDIGVVDMAQAVDSTEAVPVQLPESISQVLEDCRSRAIDYATCPSPYNNTRMVTAFQYLEHQVRQLLAAHAHGITQAKQGGAA